MNNIPWHPLLLHASVILIPLTFLCLVLVVAVKRWQDKYAHLAIAVAILAGIAAPIASASGEELEEQTGLAVASHALYGTVAMGTAVAAAVIAVVWFIALRKWNKEHILTTLLGWLSVVVALVATVFVILAGHTGAQAVWTKADTPAASSAPTSSATTTNSAIGGTMVNGERIFTREEVAQHNTAASCYTIIDDDVYDLTTWISKHPGGEKAIKGLCGKDGTAAFTKKHGGKDKVENKLETFEIGSLPDTPDND